MRNPSLWIGLAAAIGPLFMAGTLFVPVAVALVGVPLQISHKGPGIATGVWVALVAAVICGAFVYTSHFEAIRNCEAIASGERLTWVENILRDSTETRFEMIEAGCNNLPGYTMPSNATAAP